MSGQPERYAAIRWLVTHGHRYSGLDRDTWAMTCECGWAGEEYSTHADAVLDGRQP